MKKWLVGLAVVMALLWCGSAMAETCVPIANWNFEDQTEFVATGTGGGGGQTGYFVGAGFSSSYTALNPASTGSWTLGPEKYYTIGSNPHDYHSAWGNFGAYSGSKMMIINALNPSQTSGGTIIWEETVAVNPYTMYLFSYQFALSHPSAPPQLRVLINGVDVGLFDSSDPLLGLEVGEWYKVPLTPWFSYGATQATIQLIDQTIVAFGDDFCIDDIEFCMTSSLPPGFCTAGTELVMGRKHVPVGSVNILTDANGDMFVTYTITDPEWCFTELHLQVGGPFPLTKKGNAIPGKFEYNYVADGCETSHTFTIPAGPLATANICIAAHAALRGPEIACPDGVIGSCYEDATGWGLGTDFPGSDWSMKFCFPACQLPQ